MLDRAKIFISDNKVSRKQFLAGLVTFVMLLLAVTSFIVVITRSSSPFSSELLTSPESSLLKSANNHSGNGSGSGRVDQEDRNRDYEDCHFSDEILSMAKGVDITKLDLVPMSLKGIEGNPGIKSQLIKLTCSRHFSKLDPSGHLISVIPDQFMPNSYETMSAFGASFDTEEHTERTTRDSKVSLALSVGIDILKLGMFSSSASYERKRKKMITQESYISEMNVFHLVRSAEFRSPKSVSVPLEGNDDFQNCVTALPLTFEENPTAYLDLLAKYGTHYFALARFGGVVKVTTEVTKSLRQVMSQDEIDAKLSFSYKIFFKGSMDFNLFENVTTSQFRGMTTSAKYSHGGDASLAFTGDLENWIRSVPTNPRLIGGKLVPITTLVPPSKVAAIGRAIQVYLGLAYIKDLKACLGISLQKGIGDVYHQRRLMGSLAVLTHEKIQDEVTLTSLGTEVAQSLHQSSFGTVTISVLRGEERSNSSEERSSYIEIGIFEVKGRRDVTVGTTPKFIRRETLQTLEMTESSNPMWNDEFQLSLEFEAAVQFCLHSRTSSLIGVSTEQLDCGGYEPIFSAQNRRAGVENRIRFSSLDLFFKIHWEPFGTSEEDGQVKPI